MARITPGLIEEDERSCRGAPVVEWPGVGVRQRGGVAIVADARPIRDIADEFLAPEGPGQAARLAIRAEIPLRDANDAAVPAPAPAARGAAARPWGRVAGVRAGAARVRVIERHVLRDNHWRRLDIRDAARDDDFLPEDEFAAVRQVVAAEGEDPARQVVDALVGRRIIAGDGDAGEVLGDLRDRVVDGALRIFTLNDVNDAIRGRDGDDLPGMDEQIAAETIGPLQRQRIIEGVDGGDARERIALLDLIEDGAVPNGEVRRRDNQVVARHEVR